MTLLQNLKVFTWNAAFSFSFPLHFFSYLQQEIPHRFRIADVHSRIKVVRYTSVGSASFCSYILRILGINVCFNDICAPCMCNFTFKQQVQLCYNTSVAADGFLLWAAFALTIFHKD